MFLHKASRCPVWPALNASTSVIYNFRNPQNMGPKIVKFKNGQSELISAYAKKAENMDEKSRRKRRDVHVREERVGVGNWCPIFIDPRLSQNSETG